VRCEHAAFVGLEVGDRHLHGALRSVELAAAPAFLAGELPQEEFMDATGHVVGLRCRFIEAGVSEGVQLSFKVEGGAAE